MGAYPAAGWAAFEASGDADDSTDRLPLEPFGGLCANPGCSRPADDVVLVTTAHVRRFCSVECVAAGQRVVQRALVEVAHGLRGEYPPDPFVLPNLDPKLARAIRALIAELS